MKRLLHLLPFTLSLFSNILVLMLFAATGDARFAVAIPFCLVILLITHEYLID